MSIPRRSALSAFLLAVVVTGLSGPAAAPAAAQTTWTVDLLGDENDGACTPGDCSLREAVAAAASGDTVVFDLPGSPPWTLRLATGAGLGPIGISQAVAILGPGSAELTISGDTDANGTGDLRLFDVAATGALELADLSLRDGRAVSAASRDGGCIRSAGSLSLLRVEIAGCRAWSGGTTGFTGNPGGSGGSIYNAVGAVLTVDLSSFTGNRAGKGDIGPDGMAGAPGGHGGAIANAGFATVRRSSFLSNFAGDGGQPWGHGGDGGAIANRAGGSLRLDDSTLATNRSGDGVCQAFGNGADGRGGGLHSAGETAVNNSTLSGNALGSVAGCTAAQGGGLAVSAGVTRLRNVTVAGNTANGAGGGLARDGGTLRLRHLLAGGNAANGVNKDCTTNVAAEVVSEGYNVVGVINGCAGLTATGDQTGTSGAPLAIGVGPLADHGGPTLTRPLLEGSPAIDAGDPGAGCLAWDPVGAVDLPMTTDQRGELRPTDGDGDTVALCDAGAFEAPAVEPVEHLLSVTLAGSGAGAVTSDPAGIDCPGDCSESYLEGTQVELLAQADTDSQFTGWSGDCAGTGACLLTMSAARAVTATFTARFDLTVSLAGDGAGTVTSSPAGIDCPGTCAATYLDQEPVTLSAEASPGSFFAGWSGDCAGSGECLLVLSADRAAVATFLSESLFSDDFESGTYCAWSQVAGGGEPCP